MKVYYFGRELKGPLEKADLVNHEYRHAGFIVDDPQHGLVKFEVHFHSSYEMDVHYKTIPDYYARQHGNHPRLKDDWAYQMGSTNLSLDDITYLAAQWVTNHPKYEAFGDNCRTFTDFMLHELLGRHGELFSSDVLLYNKKGHLKSCHIHINQKRFQESPCREAEHRLHDEGPNVSHCIKPSSGNIISLIEQSVAKIKPIFNSYPITAIPPENIKFSDCDSKLCKKPPIKNLLEKLDSAANRGDDSAALVSLIEEFFANPKNNKYNKKSDLKSKLYGILAEKEKLQKIQSELKAQKDVASASVEKTAVEDTTKQCYQDAETESDLKQDETVEKLEIEKQVKTEEKSETENIEKQCHEDTEKLNVEEKSEQSSDIEQLIADSINKEKINLERLETTYFWIQTSQLSMDAIFFLVTSVLEYISKNNEEKEALQRSAEKIKVPVSLGLQLASHHYYSKISAIKNPGIPFSAGLNLSRCGLLSTQLLHAVANTFEWENPAVTFAGEYALPIAQLSLSTAFIIFNPGNLIAGVLSFPPEIALNIPEVNQFLLQPNPNDQFGYPRFVLGMVLKQLIDNRKSLLSVAGATQTAGYLSAYSDTLSTWLTSLIPYFLSEKNWNAFLQILKDYSEFFLSFTPTKESLKDGLSFFLKEETIKKLFQSMNEFSNLNLIEKLGIIYSAFRVMEFGSATCDALVLAPENWKRYCLAYPFIQLHKKHVIAGSAELFLTPADGNCLFHAITPYVEYNHIELRQLAVDYEKNHREELEDHYLIEGDFDEHIQKISQGVLKDKKTWGSSSEIYALSKALNRPIIVILNGNIPYDHILPEILKLSGDPIFVFLKGDHYSGFLVRGEYYFERDYAKKLAAEKTKLDAVQQANPMMRQKAAENLRLFSTVTKLDATQQKTSPEMRQKAEANLRLFFTAPNSDGWGDKKIVSNVWNVGFFANTGLTEAQKNVFRK